MVVWVDPPGRRRRVALVATLVALAVALAVWAQDVVLCPCCACPAETWWQQVACWMTGCF
jgi:predicted membrane protein